MSKVTSKLQVTVPKAIADQYGIRPGDNLEWTPAGDTILVSGPSIPSHAQRHLTHEERVALFRQSTARLKEILAGRSPAVDAPQVSKAAKERGWTREDLYTRGFPR